MRLIMFINSYIEGLSGGDIWAVEIAKRLSIKNNIELFVITPERAATLWKEKGLDHCTYLKTTKENKPGFIPFLYLKRILDYFNLNLKTNENDILFASSIFIPDVIPLLFLNGKKVSIFHMQAPHPFKGYKNELLPSQKTINVGNIINWLNEKISILLLKIKKTNMLVIPFTKNIVKSFGFQDNQIFLTKNGIDLNYIKNISSGKQEFDACWIGRPHAQKGLEDLIEIWRMVSKICPKAKLVLMGTNTEIYTELIKKNKLENNIFIKGYVSDKEKFEIMKKSRLYVSTSYFESFHIAILEALSCGLDVIAYDLPVYMQTYGNLLDYVEIANKKEFAEKLKSYLSNKSFQFNNAKKIDGFISKYDWSNISEEVYQYLMKLK